MKNTARSNRNQRSSKPAGRVAVFLLVSVCPAVAASARPVPVVEVDGDRLLLGQVAAQAPEELQQLDLGPAPSPGQRRELTAAQVQAVLDRAQVGPMGWQLPRRVRVVRPAQRLSATELHGLLAAAAQAHLPAGAVLRSVDVDNGLLMPRGEIAVSIRTPRSWRSGRQSLQASVTAGQTAPRQVVFTADVELPASGSTRLVARGQPVTLVARSGAVTARTSGVAQQAGAVGEEIAVMPRSGQAAVRGRIVDAKTVEVQP